MIEGNQIVLHSFCSQKPVHCRHVYQIGRQKTDWRYLEIDLVGVQVPAGKLRMG